MTAKITRVAKELYFHNPENVHRNAIVIEHLFITIQRDALDWTTWFESHQWQAHDHLWSSIKS